MADDVGIVNSALIKIGHETISSLDDSAEASNQYPIIRDKLLRSHNWNFATKREKLARLSETPVFEFDYAYQLPADNLRVVTVHDNDVGDVGVRYKLEDGTKLLCNSEDVYLRYISQVTDVNLMPPDFREFISTSLAIDLATSIAESRTLKESLREDAKSARRQARSTDAIEDYPEKFPPGSWVTSRGN